MPEVGTWGGKTIRKLENRVKNTPVPAFQLRLFGLVVAYRLCLLLLRLRRLLCFALAFSRLVLAIGFATHELSAFRIGRAKEKPAMKCRGLGYWHVTNG